MVENRLRCFYANLTFREKSAREKTEKELVKVVICYRSHLIGFIYIPISPQVCLFIHLAGFLLHHVEELWKVDGAVTVHIHLQHEVEELVLGGVLAHGAHHAQQLLGGDGAAPVLDTVIHDTTVAAELVTLTLSNASNASFSSAFIKLARSEAMLPLSLHTFSAWVLIYH